MTTSINILIVIAAGVILLQDGLCYLIVCASGHEFAVTLFNFDNLLIGSMDQKGKYILVLASKCYKFPPLLLTRFKMLVSVIIFVKFYDYVEKNIKIFLFIINTIFSCGPNSGVTLENQNTNCVYNSWDDLTAGLSRAELR